MTRLPLIALLTSLALSACTTVTPCPDPPAKKMVKQPETVFEFFKQSVRCDNYGDAYDVLHKDTKQRVSHEEFYFLFTQSSVIKRLILSTTVHELKVQPDGITARLTLCNGEFGLHRTFTIRKPSIGIWTIDVTPEEMEDLKDVAKQWIQKQSELMGDR